VRVVRSPRPARHRIRVGVADRAVVTGDTVLSTSGLGSCIAVVLHDPEAVVGGLAHAMLPRFDDGRNDDPDKYVDTAVDRTCDEALAAGAVTGRLTARVVGGSEMLAVDREGESIGSRNVAAAHELLEELGLTVAAVDVGGTNGRSVRFDVATGEVSIRTAGGTTSL
jgi:chemotaxis protein CheD